MRQKLLFILFFFLIKNAVAQAPFITTWEVTADDLTVTIPINFTGGLTYNYTVDFGDGTILTNQTDSVTHTYSTPGLYTVEISGAFPAIRCASLDSNDKKKLKSIEQWGDIEWKTMNSAFAFCRDFQLNATDAPDLSQVTNLSGMFWDAESMNGPMDHWDVSNVTNMSVMFTGAVSFDQPLNSWDVSNVVTMSAMFKKDDQSINNDDMIFNQPLNNWDVSNVTSMRDMFQGNAMFNQDISSWDVSNVTDMEEMFRNTSAFNQPLDSWDVSSVTNMDLMFIGALAFNQPLNSWDVSNVLTMEFMFSYTEAFNGDIGNWDISNITSLQGMFRNALAFNKPIGNWDVSNVTNMSLVFENAAAFNQPIDNWNVSNVETMWQMFRNAASFNQSLNSWDVSNVTSMSRMFQDASSFNGAIDNWVFTNITNFTDFFENASSFNQPLDNWDVSHVTSMSSMFRGASSFNQSLDSWDVSNVTSMFSMFREASSFNQPLPNWDVTNLQSASSMFSDATSYNQSMETWNLVNVDFIAGFLDNTNLSIANYDAFLEHMVSLNRTNLTLGANGLEYCNELVRDILTDERGWNISGDSLAQGCNTITGTIYYDADMNGCAMAEVFSEDVFVNVVNTDTNLENARLAIGGNYSIPVNGENYAVSILSLPDYFSITPQTANVSFTNTTTQTVDFCITPTQTINDLNIVVIPLSLARPGFQANYQLAVENIGTTTLSNISVNLTFDDAMQSFVSANPMPVSTTANSLEFTIPSLAPLTRTNIEFTMQTFPPPTVNGNDVLNFVANVLPTTNDNTPDDNTYTLSQIVVNSFDPNDKQVLEGDAITIDEADEYLNYVIRFQNTGTASAINVQVIDQLNDKLDWSTLSITGASDPYEVSIENGQFVAFSFENINLPAQIIDDPGSNGFISYKIKPKSDVQIGDIITGNAFIFFDFNAPIITNTVSTEIIEPLSVTENIASQFKVYPSLVNTEIFIEGNTSIDTISIYDINGRLLHATQSIGSFSTNVNVSNLSKGMYFLEIQSKRQKQTYKFIKK